MIMRNAPVVSWAPPALQGSPIIAIGACYSGKPEEGERLMAPLKSHGAPIIDALKRQPYTKIQSILDAMQPDGRRSYWKSEYLAELKAGLFEKVMKQAAGIRSPHSIIFLMQIGGALNNLPDGYSPVGNRDARFVILIMGSWEHADDDATHVKWAREAWSDIRPFSTGGTYLNFLAEDEGRERTAAALGKNLQRLAEVKAKWDPQNVFRTNRNIQPARLPAPSD